MLLNGVGTPSTAAIVAAKSSCCSVMLLLAACCPPLLAANAAAEASKACSRGKHHSNVCLREHRLSTTLHIACSCKQSMQAS